jgi:hypothetical protein
MAMVQAEIGFVGVLRGTVLELEGPWFRVLERRGESGGDGAGEVVT